MIRPAALDDVEGRCLSAMDEQALLSQIGGMLDMHSTQIQQEVAQVRQEVDEKFAVQDIRIDEKPAAQNTYMHAIIQEVLQAIGEQFTAFKGGIIREMRVLFGNIEGRGIRVLEEESAVGRATLADHEVRITHQEETVGTR